MDSRIPGTRTYWVQVNVAGKFRCVFIGLDQYRLNPSLEQMAGPFAFDVEIGRIGGVQYHHELKSIYQAFPELAS
jgi:hypothetical protein